MAGEPRGASADVDIEAARLGEPELRAVRKCREGVKSFARVAPGTSLGAERAARARGSEGVNTV